MIKNTEREIQCSEQEANVAGFRIPLWCNFNYMGREAVNLFPRGSICPPPRATDTATRSSVYEKEQDYNYPIIELVLK